MKHFVPPTLLLALLSGGLAAQQRFQFGGESLQDVRAELDPMRGCSITGKTQQGVVHTLTIAFGELQLPAPGASKLGADSLGLQLDGKPQQGRLAVEVFDCSRLALRGETQADGATTTFACDVTPAPPTVAIVGAENPKDHAAVSDKPVADDIVFAALGNTGSGLPGQHRVGKAVGALAASGPLDFVLLLGDSFLPGGVTSMGDAKWQRCFEQPYPEFTLPVPFHAVPGARDLRGDEAAFLGYAVASWRWQPVELAADFTVQSHGKDVCLIGFDAARYFGDEGDRRTGATRRTLLARAARSQAAWKIVFANVSLYPQAGEAQPAAPLALREELGAALANAGVDIYVAAGGRYLEVQQPTFGPLQICSGGGAGPELAQSGRWGRDTQFAATGGGFFWFRYDGLKWEISARDSDGKVLYTYLCYPR